MERLFDVSIDIDEHVSSMSDSGERAIGGVTGGAIGLGESVTWRARHFGVRFTMTSTITAWDRPHRFVDEQTRGPFRSFRHEHAFSHEGDHSTMVDTITLASPLGGRLVERVILVPYLRRLIRRRNGHLLDVLGLRASTQPTAAQWLQGGEHEFARSEISVVVGRGDAVWRRASRDVLGWAVKTRSGFAVDDPARLSAGDVRLVTARVAGITIREPIEVVEVVDTPSRVGFSYRTLPGHPVRGEEAFVVDRDGDVVRLTIRSLTAPAASGPWRLLYPLLRIAQVVARRRYLRALR